MITKKEQEYQRNEEIIPESNTKNDVFKFQKTLKLPVQHVPQHTRQNKTQPWQDRSSAEEKRRWRHLDKTGADLRGAVQNLDDAEYLNVNAERE